jgi:hypothetical protein
MKYLWIQLMATLVGCAGCENRPDPAVTFPNGEVTAVAFAQKGQGLVAVNEFDEAGGRREKTHTRLRRFNTSDWKITADSGDLSLADFTLAACEGTVWAAEAQEFFRQGNGNPMGDSVMYKIDPKALRLTPIFAKEMGW